MKPTTTALIIWGVFFIAGLLIYSFQKKKPTFEGNRKRSLWSGGLIVFATASLVIFFSAQDMTDQVNIFAKDFVLLLGGIIGGSLFSSGIQKQTES